MLPAEVTVWVCLDRRVVSVVVHQVDYLRSYWDDLVEISRVPILPIGCFNFEKKNQLVCNFLILPNMESYAWSIWDWKFKIPTHSTVIITAGSS